jgi:hypothetical protein
MTAALFQQRAKALLDSLDRQGRGRRKRKLVPADPASAVDIPEGNVGKPHKPDGDGS